MFPHTHLLGIRGLDRPAVEKILRVADGHADRDEELRSHVTEPPKSLDKRTLINLFFENSTRTQASFELAAKRLGATVMNMSVKGSSVSKGETLLDTAATLNAMMPDIIVVRHQESGAVQLLAEKVNCAVVNAGDGWHEHPTQALLDALTIRRAFRARRGDDSPASALEGLKIAICGDIAHSRVARSNILLHTLFGNEVRVAGPASLIPAGVDALGVRVCRNVEEAVEDADVVMTLRLQSERMDGAHIASRREYFHSFGLDAEVLDGAADDAVVMHPGPMNRGVEIESALADDPVRSVIATQVQLGVAVRMAVLELVNANLPHRARQSDRDPRVAPPGRFLPARPRASEPPAPGAPGGQPQAFVNASLVDPETGGEEPGALVVENGRIAAVGAAAAAMLRENPTTPSVDCGGATLAPGLVDLRVFIGEPGERSKESFASGGEAAAAGGVTTIVTQPNTTPPVDDPALLEFIARRVEEERGDRAIPRVRTMAALTKGLGGAEMTEFAFLLDAGAVGLSDGARTVADTAVFRRCLDAAAALGALVAHTPSELALTAGACATEGAFATLAGLPAAPAAAESIGLSRDLAIAKLARARLHATPISTAASVDAIRRAKEDGVAVTAAAGVHHLTLSETAIGEYRTYYKLNPPLRAEADRAALVQALADGVIDCVVSAHSPQDEEAKRRPFESAVAGAVGLETLLSASLGLVADGALGMPALFRALSLNPARLIGSDAGRLAAGAPADLILFDPSADRVIDRWRLRSKSKNTPFDKARLRGRVLRTIVGGRTIFIDDAEPAA